jgi:hypothetical protein
MGRDEERVYVIGRKARGKETTGKTKTYVDSLNMNHLGTGLVWLRIGKSGVGSIKCWELPSAAQVVASRVVLSSTELVSKCLECYFSVTKPLNTNSIKL